MAIHIKELMIRANVGANGKGESEWKNGAKKSGEDGCQSGSDKMVRKAVDEVFRIMEDKKYR